MNKLIISSMGFNLYREELLSAILPSVVIYNSYLNKICFYILEILKILKQLKKTKSLQRILCELITFL